MAALTTAMLAGLSAFQTYRDIEAQKSQAKHQKLIAEGNERLAGIYAEDIERRGEREAAEHGKRGAAVVGSQRAALAAQGVDVNAGSAAEVQEDTLKLTREDELTIRNNAWREAWGVKMEAKSASLAGQVAQLGNAHQRGLTLLTGGLRLANIYADSGRRSYSSKGGAGGKG